MFFEVEAALTTDPTNDELLKLKSDLEEVILLTIDLLKAQLLEQKPDADVEGEEEINETALEELTKQVYIKKDWKVGDKCLAQWSEDGQWYEAIIEDITEDGEEVSVVFDNYQTPDVTTLSLLREIKGPVKKFPGTSASSKARKQTSSKQREYQKKRKQKKLQRYKQMEEEREGEKNKWLAFKLTNKVARKAMTKKSIFASPDNVNGRVGIGTCGMSGRPMTEFTTAEKWRKGM
ncbi:survival of motor neuron-related-splicing factor 30 isoform X2 [Bacillus rossius redtenbacheri]|uniref:survival of motor neuron-related-splicing factor 30 isoform X2 n=1 Tax=Bacillus rossius redtenbacheri TaxID=93214 RepID=UPI002FDCDCFB